MMRRLPWGRRAARLRLERRTLGLGVAVLTGAGAVVVGELARVWRRGSAPLPGETDAVLDAAEEAARQTVEVAVAGYREGTRGETALLNLMASFTVTFGLVRALTYQLRSGGRFGPMGDVRIGDRHIHHFVPGIVISLLAGAAAILARDPGLDRWLALPFGMGAALTLDESALLLELDDVYWTERGILSVQISLTALALLSSVGLALRVLRRGEREVLEEPDAPTL